PAGVERRVDVDEPRDAVREPAEHLEVVAEVDLDHLPATLPAPRPAPRGAARGPGRPSTTPAGDQREGGGPKRRGPGSDESTLALGPLLQGPGDLLRSLNHLKPTAETPDRAGT